MKFIRIIRDFFQLTQRVRELQQELKKQQDQELWAALQFNNLQAQVDINYTDIEMLKWKLKNTEFDVQYLNTIHNTEGRTNEYD
jgi:hypothetical protein